MRLIEAEVYARTGRAAQAVAAINAVRTDDADPFGLAAGLEPYDGPTDLQSLLDEIYYDRATELFLQGLRLEDQRHLNQGTPGSGAFARTRSFYAYPQQERLPPCRSTPADPALCT